MESKEQKKEIIPLQMMRRWIYMSVAILAAYFFISRPVFNFQKDTGIIYVRSFEMVEQRSVVVTQTDIKTGASEVTDTMSVIGLHYCSLAMLWGCILCLLCFFSFRGRIFFAAATEIAAGAFYLLMIVYAMRISEDQYATLYPNLFALLPAVVLEAMALTRRNVIKERVDEMDEERLIL